MWVPFSTTCRFTSRKDQALAPKEKSRIAARKPPKDPDGFRWYRLKPSPYGNNVAPSNMTLALFGRVRLCTVFVEFNGNR